mmetsp:Transcript_46280/g.86329  ORF Transcript_46280/g.86329 Transcript_46280/m.86329 type:complete len:518 (+) Transcript_46280:299-1852(+)
MSMHVNAPGHWDFFISYSPKNLFAVMYAEKLCSSLAKQGKTVWMDSNMWQCDQEAVEEGVRNSSCVIALITDGEGVESNAYLKSDDCLRVLRLTLQEGLLIQPVKQVDDTRSKREIMRNAPDDVRALVNLNWVDLNRTTMQYWDLAVKAILDRESNSSSTNSGVEPHERPEQHYSHIQQYSVEEIKAATNNFASDTEIGEGGFGKVYRGVLNGMHVAIKQLGPDSMQGEEELNQELKVLGGLHHRHLINLYGWCPEERCIVYELCENGSLATGLPRMGWFGRVRVATEIARALLFLHTRRPNAILHRDIKPENILLDDQWSTKLADMGLAKHFPEMGLDHTHMSTRIVGTVAYLDPEYLGTGQVRASSDVYSFGLVLLQMLTGRPVRGGERIQTTVQTALANNATFIDIAAGAWPITQATEFARLALECAHLQPGSRPCLKTSILPRLEELYKQAQGSFNSGEETVCAICLDASVTHAFVPCGHRCVCKHDAELVMAQSNKRCPICRAPPTQVIQIY